MLDQYFRNAGVQERINANPIRQEIAQLVHYLADRGYARQTVRTYVWAAEHFGAWLGTSDRRLRRVDRPAVVEFLREHLPGCCCPRPATKLLKSTRPGLMLLLRAIGEIPKPKRSQSRFAELLAPYVEHLRVNGGLAEKTRDTHAYYACEFLDSRFPNGPIRLGDILPHDVALFVADYAAVRKRSTARTAASSLRSFLRFLQMRGLCDESLILAVPTIRRWKLSSLPKTMTEEQLVQFLGSFDCSTATGSRDYAMALSMTHLGLRVSEVCAIELDHVNWRDGTVRIFSPKGRRIHELPLMQDVGAAIADYARSGRPKSDYRNVFLRHKFPIGASVSRELVRSAMRRAYKRSGCTPNWTGTHILRHTAATRLHQHGASIKEIADVLGHRSIDTSLIYTKVNLNTLGSVALPWPGEEQS